ncbi:hypothetical protein BD626DRAFT_30983 [Schizophyllum amplum]|uniref:Uncharacterized protein n=1 Tax=Schizophyllum amplum TaxID=97359 RepID=A0A550D0M9_9AGAR|nr:hypothetical protein BD626DRAFT_30983 [Auriculariopsis ampla]
MRLDIDWPACRNSGRYLRTLYWNALPRSPSSTLAGPILRSSCQQPAIRIRRWRILDARQSRRSSIPGVRRGDFDYNLRGIASPQAPLEPKDP